MPVCAIITIYYTIIITELSEHNELIERIEDEDKKLNVLTELIDGNDDVVGSYKSPYMN